MGTTVILSAAKELLCSRHLKVVLVAAVSLGAAATAGAQHQHGTPPKDTSHLVAAADAVMSGPMSAAAKRHMLLTPTRAATRNDSVKAMEVARELRVALEKYRDTAAAVAAGYQMFMPNVRAQRVYHFTNYRNAFKAAFRFDPAQPTSLLYQREPDGSLRLIGGMYTAPAAMRARRLDGRVPLSIARWHKHVNWCLPQKGEEQRWLERRDSLPLFGPESPIATRSECEKVGGRFQESLFGWMIHANVFLGEDLATVFGHDH